MPVKQVGSVGLYWLCTWSVKSVLEVQKGMQDFRNVLSGICGCKLWAWHLNLSRCYCIILPVLQSIFHLTRSNRPLSSDSGVQPGDQPVWADHGELGGRLHLRQPERQPSSPAGVWEQRQAVRHTRKHVYLIYHCYVHTHTCVSVFCLAN